METILIFDLDGVVFERSCFASRLWEEFKISKQMTAPFFQEPFKQCQLGRGNLKAEAAKFLQQWSWHDPVDAFLEFWFQCDSVPKLEVVGAVARLRSKGFKCCLASNQERYRAEFLSSHPAISGRFDAVFYSYEIGLRKPSMEFFQEIEIRLGVDPARLLYWDDDPENVSSARGRGWSAELFSDAPHFLETMESRIRLLP